MDRLHTLDAEFLHLEDDVQQLHIGGICVFDGPTPAFDDLVGLMAAKIHRIPRYRQRVRTVPLELGRPVWVDDPHFNLGYHLRHTALPRPGDAAALSRLMSRVMEHPLDRHRPLWEMWLVEGLADGRWALICKVHHCMVDGISGVDLLTILLDVSPDADLPEPEPWVPRPEPSGVAMVLDAWAGLVGDVVDRAGGLLRWVREPREVVHHALATGAGMVNMGRTLGPVAELSIEGDIGPHRVWAFSAVDLDAVKAVRRTFGGTVNDVVLAALAGGYRALLAERGDDPDHAVVRTLVPVSVRAADAHDAPDNQVSAIICDLPVGLEDPLERLGAVREQMAERKGAHMAEAGQAITHAGDLAPPMLLGPGSRLFARLGHLVPQRSVQTVTTNVPGPQLPLYCLGHEMVEYLPYVPIALGVRVGTAILSYNGRLAFGVTGDLDTVPEVDIVTRTAAAEITALAHRAGTAGATNEPDGTGGRP